MESISETVRFELESVEHPLDHDSIARIVRKASDKRSKLKLEQIDQKASKEGGPSDSNEQIDVELTVVVFGSLANDSNVLDKKSETKRAKVTSASRSNDSRVIERTRTRTS